MPLLGRAVRHEWALDRDFLSVNHGSFGATPRVVLAAQREWQQRMESQPGRFMRSVLPEALRRAAERLGAFVGGEWQRHRGERDDRLQCGAAFTTSRTR